MANKNEKELEILEQIYSSEETIHQRDIARIVGLSLGMTNAILKRLAQKGLLTIRKVNNRNIRYIVSPKGVEAITKRSYRYLKRTIKNVVDYRQAIEQLVRNAKKNGATGILLIGASDLDFIVEHACATYEVDYVKSPETYRGVLLQLYSETYIPDEDTKKESERLVFLQETLMAE